jgi:nucleoside-diphosphate-sugar epimerase
MAKKQRILICGHRSFAAQGLPEVLEKRGYQVVLFSRGDLKRTKNVVTGPVLEIDKNPLLEGSFDILINYILLGASGREENERYLQALLNLAQQRGTRHFVQISSISVYRSDATRIDESTREETNPQQKGPYAATKIIQDEFLKANTPSPLKLSLVRPGFILGPGLPNPIGGTALRTPWNKLLLLGNPTSKIPLISRDLVNETLASVVSHPPENSPEVVLIADPNSPTRKEYIDACCQLLGCGTHTVTVPNWIWLSAAAGAEVPARILKLSVKPFQKVASLCQDKTFGVEQSELRSGVNMSFDWRRVLTSSMDRQTPHFTIPESPERTLHASRLRHIAFVGFGRIVHQKHLPALKRLHFSGKISAKDIVPIRESPLYSVQPLNGSSSPELYVVATPGPVHHEASDLIRDPRALVLVEKPLCYTSAELRKWRMTENVFVCHNYRFKKNVLEMHEHLRRYNPGQLNEVSVELQVPPVSDDSSAWLRDERKAKTLLMDYALHYLDIACMFDGGPWKILDLAFTQNHRGQTSLIRGHISSTYSMHFMLRQGFMPRKHQIVFSFQNYAINLRFFPDTFMPHMANDYDWLHREEGRQIAKGVRRKILDKLLHVDADDSHALLYQAVATGDPARDALRVERLASFYDVLFRISDRVYETTHS